MNNRLKLTLTAFALLGSTLVTMIVVSSLEMNIWKGVRAVASTGWGLTTFLDVYIGLTFTAVWVAVLERRPARAIAWAFALFTLGNVATVAYLLLRARKVRTVTELLLGSPGPAAMTSGRPGGP